MTLPPFPALWETFPFGASQAAGRAVPCYGRNLAAADGDSSIDALSIRRRTLTGLIKRSFALAGHRTSVALEDEFWTVLQRMADARGLSLSALVAAADTARGPDRPLASALRVMALAANQTQS